MHDEVLLPLYVAILIKLCHELSSRNLVKDIWDKSTLYDNTLNLELYNSI